MIAVVSDSVTAQLALIDRARSVLRAEPRVLAAWLAGSHARGEADAYSDVDIHCLIADEDAGWFTEHWQEIAGAIMPAEMQHGLAGLIGGVCVSGDWLHLDLFFYPRSSFDPATIEKCAPLFDRTGAFDATRPTRPKPPEISTRTFESFLYIMGQLVVTLGRGEHLVALSGVTAIRDAFLVPLFLAESGSARRGGAKRLNPYLTAEQRAFLESVPAAAADRESILAAIAPMAAEYLRRARAYAATHGIEWPGRFEASTVAHLRHHLGLEIMHGTVG
jgi:hypothetical protein